MLEVTWQYTPPDHFEGTSDFSTADGELVIAEGTVKFTSRHKAVVDRGMIRTLTDTVRSIMDIRLMRTGRTYWLSEAQFHQADETGRRHYTLFVDSMTVKTTMGNVDLVVRDAQGRAVGDTRAERIKADAEYMSDMADRVGRSPTLQRMVASFAKSYTDSDNALVHLYEVQDAAAEQFGGKENARLELNISKSQWSRLGALSNAAPLSEGRHRGRQSSLRPATLEELVEARDAARAIIEAFARHTP